MVDLEKMPLHDESLRAPRGVCELSIQAATFKAFTYKGELQEALDNYVERSFSVDAFEQGNGEANNRLIIYTGTDRLDISTLRDISEVYGQVSDYDKGNIPPELSLVPTSDMVGINDYFVWLEFKLEGELPHDEVEVRLSDRLGDIEVTPKNPVGENVEAIVYRDRNVANHQVRDILNRSSKIHDSLPVEYTRLVCEGKE